MPSRTIVEGSGTPGAVVESVAEADKVLSVGEDWLIVIVREAFVTLPPGKSVPGVKNPVAL